MPAASPTRYWTSPVTSVCRPSVRVAVTTSWQASSPRRLTFAGWTVRPRTSAGLGSAVGSAADDGASDAHTASRASGPDQREAFILDVPTAGEGNGRGGKPGRSPFLGARRG